VRRNKLNSIELLCFVCWVSQPNICEKVGGCLKVLDNSRWPKFAQNKCFEKGVGSHTEVLFLFLFAAPRQNWQGLGGQSEIGSQLVYDLGWTPKKYGIVGTLHGHMGGHWR